MSEKWQVDGATVYILHQTGWHRGVPLMTNQYFFGVQGGTKEQNEQLAKRICDTLNASLVESGSDG